MKQVLQSVRGGRTRVADIPDPIVQRGSVLVANRASLISAGTERYVVDLARKSLIGKARQRPDQVKRVLQKIREEGLRSSLTQVSAKLDESMPLGYSSAGVVLECGSGVQEFKPGDRVANAGPHAGIVVVSHNLCARIPDNVTFEQAAFTSVASIALEGVRLAHVQLGERVLVIGLGLIGQICVALLKAQGCRVFGTDLDAGKLARARELGADVVEIGGSMDSVNAFTGSHGVDAVLIAAATKSNEPINFAAAACRAKGRIVLIGVAGLDIPREPFFKKELEFTVSSSLGPGRGDPVYEEKGIDYPIGYARWTAKRNMEAILDLISAGLLPVEKLTSDRFPIDRAADAYDLITSGSPMGVLLEYPEPGPVRTRKVVLRTRARRDGTLGVSVIGAGNFSRLVMLPMMRSIEGISWRGLSSAKGITAENDAQKGDFSFATSDVTDIWNDNETDAVFIVTRHDTHARLVIDALRAGKNVFVEKPLAITTEELEAIRACVEELGDRCPIVSVGFNRRFAPATAAVRDFFKGVVPLTLNYRFASAYIPADSWVQDEEVGGGRIIGEACHPIDMCVAISGSDPVEVFCQSVRQVGALETSDDRAAITILHENGSLSSISYEAGGDRAFPAERIEVFGGGRTGLIDAWSRVELWRGGKATTMPAKKDRGHQAGFAAFVEAARRGGAWPIPWEEIYGVSWAALAAVQSLRSGFPVRAYDSVDAEFS